MNTLLFVSLGQLGNAVLEGIARTGVYDRIVVASSDYSKARKKVNNVLIGAAIEGYYPIVEALHFDMYSDDAADVISDINADVIFSSPSMLPWWKLDELIDGGHTKLKNAPFATFISCHLAPVIALQKVLKAVDYKGLWVAGSYPDVVNTVLHRTGIGPVCGVGNVLEAIPKIKFQYKRKYGIPHTDKLQIRLVAQHAFEYYLYCDSVPESVPPYLLEVMHNDELMPPLEHEELFSPMPIPYQLDFNLITASAAIVVLRALVQSEPVHTHVPAPNGLAGGYPVTVSNEGVNLDLSDQWSIGEAVKTNLNSLPYDGIESIDADGAIRLSYEAVNTLRALGLEKHAVVYPETAGRHAKDLIDAIGSA